MVAGACPTGLLASGDVAAAQCILRGLGFTVSYILTDLSVTYLASMGEIKTYAIISPSVRRS